MKMARVKVEIVTHKIMKVRQIGVKQSNKTLPVAEEEAALKEGGTTIITTEAVTTDVDAINLCLNFDYICL